MGYSVWSPWPWVFFALGVAILVLSVKLFHKRYPGFPTSIELLHEEARTLYAQPAPEGILLQNLEEGDERL